MVISAGCILIDDFEALRFAKNDLDASRACFERPSGEDGTAGIGINVGEMGDAGKLDWSVIGGFGNWAGEIERLDIAACCVNAVRSCERSPVGAW